MDLRENLGILSATLGAAAAFTGLAYVVLRRQSEAARVGALQRTRSSARASASLTSGEGGTARPLGPYIVKASMELADKDLRDIQLETALTWTGRACAAANARNFLDAREYAHEGLEHAALCNEPGLLHQVRSALSAHGVDL